jgi:hypothetical protein
MAALRSIGVMGASIAVGLTLHQRPKISRTMQLAPDPSSRLRRKPTPAIEPSAAENPRAITHAKSAREHVSEFMMEYVRPDPAGTASLRELHARYLPWCAAKAKHPLPLPTLGRELRKIIDAVGLTCEAEGADITIRGASLTS